MDSFPVHVEIEIDEENGEWVEHLPSEGGYYKCTFRGPATLWITNALPSIHPQPRIPLRVASVTVPIPRHIYHRRSIPPPSSTPTSSVDTPSHLRPTVSVVDIPKDCADTLVYTSQGGDCAEPLVYTSQGDIPPQQTTTMSTLRQFPETAPQSVNMEPSQAHLTNVSRDDGVWIGEEIEMEMEEEMTTLLKISQESLTPPDISSRM